MKRILLLWIVGCTIILDTVSAQTKIVTTGNNLVNPADPYAADIVIGSDQNGGIRHDASIMWWNSGSASRISNTGDTFLLSQWGSTTPNIGLSAAVGGSSYFKGKVSIGTTIPFSLLSVNSGLSAPTTPSLTNSIVIGSANANAVNKYLGQLGFVSNDVDFSAPKMVAYISGEATETYTDDTKTGSVMRFYTGNNGGSSPVERMVIDNRGYIGIGTATPKETLSVNGNIRSKQIKVETANWPDYVFQKDYQLPSLTDVKTYIEQNKHLPEVPSEQEIAREGLNLGEMNKLLMKKVEELTLYLIEQNKRIDEQQKQINKLSWVEN
ncbi:hypothetical protein SNE25_00535 [Mucilaginibacter sabulilitoris]|uniref:Peptidase S74 domain-containing protein n=1 Tax=Mucilaginibacter sabulilitoris TaxID=1173583 RepID=A0ABZ0TMP5_9SPHI|nr:hypothetical protein [Mucilaginibacter sabulilitoris]WPU94011.1 hypothetical protein SNE25_00535 [Mucilaginibacter sabulilitoris]